MVGRPSGIRYDLHPFLPGLQLRSLYGEEETVYLFRKRLGSGGTLSGDSDSVRDHIGDS